MDRKFGVIGEKVFFNRNFINAERVYIKILKEIKFFFVYNYVLIVLKIWLKILKMNLIVFIVIYNFVLIFKVFFEKF